MQEDRVPSGEAKGVINIKVRGQDGLEIFFKLKPKTKMKKVFRYYFTKTNTQHGSVRFIFDGNRLLENDTVQSLGMQNDDVIEAMVEQTGGLVVSLPPASLY